MIRENLYNSFLNRLQNRDVFFSKITRILQRLRQEQNKFLITIINKKTNVCLEKSGETT